MEDKICRTCGETKSIIEYHSSYDFHHINYLEKEFNWNVARKKSFDGLLPEIKKCIVLCENCHQMIHTKLNNDGTLNSEYVQTNL